MSSLTVNICNLKMLLVVLAVWLVVGGERPDSLIKVSDNINQTIFRLGLYVTQLPPPKTSITVVHVPELEYERWLADLPGAKRLLSVLNDNQNADKKKDKDGKGQPLLFGIVLEKPIALIQPESESLLIEIQQGRTNNQHFYQEANEALARRAELVQTLNSDRVILGLYRQQSTNQRPVETHLGQMKDYPPFSLDWLWPGLSQTVDPITTPVLNYFPLFTEEGTVRERSLVVNRDSGYFSGFLIEFLRRAEAMESNQTLANDLSSIEWFRDVGFRLDKSWIKTSPTGSIIPVYGELSGIQRPLRQIGLSAALAQGDLNGWVLVGLDSSPVLYKTAQELASLGDNAQMFTPVWGAPLQKILFIALLFFLILLIPSLPNRRGLFFLLFVSSSLIAMQLIAQALYGFWLPSGELLIFTAFGYGLMLLWQLNNDHYRVMSNRADDATTVVAIQRMQTASNEADLNQVFSMLSGCKTSESVLDAMYQLQDQFAGLSLYPQSLDVLKALRRRKRGFRDVAEKIKRLKIKLGTEKGAIDFDHMSGADDQNRVPDQVLALPSPTIKQEKANFGRYEIDRELGRGATGTVYLAYDPLISRQVAIKTLNYHQFSETEIEAVKSRFAREAEAAGGLNHPNIVPVFDVGEESGSAYIAMDFAKGSPLSDFAVPDNLLTPYEVYRIVLAVAEALEYAHNHKIVHRDIKPGNILYCNEPFQVRITDFGIARFVDHSHTQTGEILGSPLYMAPEQLLGKEVSYSADIFSLGVTFYQLLTGTLPFNGDSLASLTYDIVHTKHKGARVVRKSLPASSTRITNVALQKKATDRYMSAEAMADAVRKAIKRDFSEESKKEG